MQKPTCQLSLLKEPMANFGSVLLNATSCAGWNANARFHFAPEKAISVEAAFFTRAEVRLGPGLLQNQFMHTLALRCWHGPFAALGIALLNLQTDEGQEPKQHCSHDKTNHAVLTLVGIEPLAVYPRGVMVTETDLALKSCFR